MAEQGGSHIIAVALSVVAGVVVAPLLLLFMLLGGALFTGCSSASAEQSDDSSSTTVTNADYKAPEHSPDPVAEKSATFMESTALDDSHGYSQARRGGNPDYDCSSLVYFAVRHAGVAGLPSSPFSTFTMGRILQSAGYTHFTWSGRTADAKRMLKRGDIVVNPVEHTEMYVGGGLFAAARHATPSGVEDGHPGDQGKGANQEIIISSYLDPGLTQVYRHDPSAAEKTDTSSTSDTTTIGTTVTASQCDTSGVADAADVTNGSVGQAKSVARQIVSKQFPSDGDKEYSCLEQLWEHESGWRVNAENPSSGAYGIPQALPGSKMSSTGPDWKTNATTQIKWGLDYIKTRPDYGTPCAAWDKWQSRSPHWY